MTTMTMAKALNVGLRRAMEDNAKVLLMGEDIGRLGGVFRITDGLQKDFGEDRVIDAPLAESAIVGTAVGLARGHLDRLGVIPAAQLGQATPGRVLVAGAVTHRQAPETARGAVFLNLEDETGHVNVIFSKGAWVRWKHGCRVSISPSWAG